MQRYRFIDHTADTQLQVEGSSRKDLFEAALTGMNEIIWPGFCKSCSDFPFSEEIHLKSTDPTALLIDFLSEVLYFTQTKHTLYCRWQWTELREQQLAAILYGQKVDAFEEDIKAVTYHEAEIWKNNKGRWQTDIIFDI